MRRTQAPMSASRIEQGPYDIDTPSYDIETGFYEKAASIQERPRWGLLVP